MLRSWSNIDKLKHFMFDNTNLVPSIRWTTDKTEAQRTEGTSKVIHELMGRAGTSVHPFTLCVPRRMLRPQQAPAALSKARPG